MYIVIGIPQFIQGLPVNTSGNGGSAFGRVILHYLRKYFLGINTTLFHNSQAADFLTAST